MQKTTNAYVAGAAIPTNENALSHRKATEGVPVMTPGGCKFTLSARQRRVLEALASTTGRISRESIDRIAGASNGPAVIAALRHKLGRDAIETHRADAIDRDGHPCKPGCYELAPQARALVAELMKEAI